MVAMNVWPTDASDGSVATEARWRKMGRVWAPSGVVAGIGLEMAPTLAYPNLTVRNGACWVDGHFCELPADQVLTVTANGLAVVRFDPAANTAELLYRDAVSVPAQSPTGTYELPIAKLTGSTGIDVRALVSQAGELQFVSNAARDLWASPPNGAKAFTLDTSITWLRRLSIWEQFSPRFRGSAQGSTLNGDTVQRDIPGAAVTFTMYQGHRYRIDFYCVVQEGGGGPGIVNVLVANASNQQIGAAAGGHVNAGWFATFTGVVEDLPAGPSGTITYKLRAVTSAGTVTVQGNSNIVVTDVGIG